MCNIQLYHTINAFQLVFSSLFGQFCFTFAQENVVGSKKWITYLLFTFTPSCCVCVFLNMHFNSQVRTFWRVEDIVAAPDEFKGLFGIRLGLKSG